MKTNNSVTTITRGIISYLEKKHSLDLLPLIAEELKKLSWVKVDPGLATILSSHKLSLKQNRSLAQALTKYFGRQIHLRSKIDPNIIAGFKIQIAGREIDATLNRRLEALKQTLIYD